MRSSTLAHAGRTRKAKHPQRHSSRDTLSSPAELKKQDPQLLDLLIEQYQHRLLRYLLFLTGKRDLAEDLFQETWMRVLTRGAQYDGRARFDTWLFTIARNLVIDSSRKRRLSLDEMTENSEDAQAFRDRQATNRRPSTICAPSEWTAHLATVLLKISRCRLSRGAGAALP